MHRLCEYIDTELEMLERKIDDNGGLTEAEIRYGDLLAHFKKSILTNKGMERNTYSYGNSRRNSNDRPYYDDGGMSNARGRGRNARRDSMGRFSRESYSYDDAKEDMMSELRELMQEAPDEETRKEFKRFMSKLSDM